MKIPEPSDIPVSLKSRVIALRSMRLKDEERLHDLLRANPDARTFAIQWIRNQLQRCNGVNEDVSSWSDEDLDAAVSVWAGDPNGFNEKIESDQPLAAFLELAKETIPGIRARYRLRAWNVEGWS
jgi:hypothetical protein